MHYYKPEMEKKYIYILMLMMILAGASNTISMNIIANSNY
jgi:hypothetical protein